MYAFAKVHQLEQCYKSSSAKVKPQPEGRLSSQSQQPPHIPNQTILEQEPSPLVDPLNLEDWLSYWAPQFVKGLRENLLHPPPCSSLIKLATTELTATSSLGINKNNSRSSSQTHLYDPNSLQIVEEPLSSPNSVHNNALRGMGPSSGFNMTSLSAGLPLNNRQPSITVTKYIPSSNDGPFQSTSHPPSSSTSVVIPLLQTLRRRKPMEEIQQLYTHVASISSNCAQAYTKCQSLVGDEEPLFPIIGPRNDPELEPDALLINVLAHQIGGLDVSLSASMDKSCKLFLEGMKEIIGTIDFICDVRNAFYQPLSPERIEKLHQETTPIARLLDKVNSMIVFSDDLKFSLIKLQMEALLVITWPLGSSNFRNYLSSLQSTVTALLKTLEDDSQSSFEFLEWEKEDEFLRDEYFRVMDAFYFQKRRFSNHYDSELLHKLNYHAKWLNHIREKYSGKKAPSPASSSSSSSHTKPTTTKGASSKTTDEFKASSPGKEQSGGGPQQEPKAQYQRHRDSKELIIQLTNHLLHINNSRTKFIRLTMIHDLDQKRKSCFSEHNTSPSQALRSVTKLPTREACQILLNILEHQIQGLDIALSSEIFNSIKCFLHGLYDTSCSIMSIMSDQYYDQRTHSHLPLDPGFLPKKDDAGEINNREGGGGGGGGDHAEYNKDLAWKNINRLQETLRRCNNIILKRKSKAKWKHTLLKLQLEALILTQSSPDTDIFRHNIELMAGTAETAYSILGKQWYIPYSAIAWDNAQEDHVVFNSYWDLLNTCLKHDRNY